MIYFSSTFSNTYGSEIEFRAHFPAFHWWTNDITWSFNMMLTLVSSYWKSNMFLFCFKGIPSNYLDPAVPKLTF